MRNKTYILIFILILVVAFTGAAAITANRTIKAGREAIAKEEAPLDKYSMSEYSAKNSAAVFEALKAGDESALKKLLIKSDGTGDVMEFADWASADFDNAISMGSGSLTAKPNKKGRMDESERFFVDVGDSRYVFFIETLTSDYGRVNEGVSAVGVTTYSHFDATDYSWNGEKDDESALAGELFWNK
ncbi:MAG: hypothetical protein IJH92_02275 [Mogibacterium sp.]|nr:hypothetical protein [Mogibacterium sp.]